MIACIVSDMVSKELRVLRLRPLLACFVSDMKQVI